MWWFHSPSLESWTSEQAQQRAKDTFEAHIVTVRVGTIDTPGWALFDGQVWRCVGRFRLVRALYYIGKGGGLGDLMLATLFLLPLLCTSVI